MAHSPQRPTIPAVEYPTRWNKVQAMLAELDLDYLVAYADDRATFGPAHARWLANFPVHFEPACILLPREGAPVMLVGPESDQYALLSGQIADVRVLREFTHPDEDYPYAKIHSLAEIIADLGGGKPAPRRVGLGGRGLISRRPAGRPSRPPCREPNGWTSKAPCATCGPRNRRPSWRSSATPTRSPKPASRRRWQAIAPGVTEREIAAEIDAAMRRAGSEGTGIDTIVASGPNTRPILARSTFRRIEPNDMVLLTIAPRYEGYHAAIGRLVLVGDPGAEVRRALEVAVQAQQACAAALRPGIEGRQVEAIGRRIVEEAGLGQYFLYSGVHSLGVIEFEPPIFGPSSPAVLKEDMIISIDIPMFNAPWGGLRVENGYRITADGAEPLHDTPYWIQK